MMDAFPNGWSKFQRTTQITKLREMSIEILYKVFFPKKYLQDLCQHTCSSFKISMEMKLILNGPFFAALKNAHENLQRN
jgi:uncharacterized membrane protein